jgi:hypothetical protein
VSREVDRDDLVPLGKVGDLRAPVASVTRPAVDEDQRRRALAFGFEMHGNAIT